MINAFGIDESKDLNAFGIKETPNAFGIIEKESPGIMQTFKDNAGILGKKMISGLENAIDTENIDNLNTKIQSTIPDTIKANAGSGLEAIKNAYPAMKQQTETESLKQWNERNPENTKAVEQSAKEANARPKTINLWDEVVKANKSFWEMNEEEWGKKVDQSSIQNAIYTFPAKIMETIAKIGNTISPENEPALGEQVMTYKMIGAPAWKGGENAGKYIYDRTKNSIGEVYQKIAVLSKTEAPEKILNDIPKIVEETVSAKVRPEDAKKIIQSKGLEEVPKVAETIPEVAVKSTEELPKYAGTSAINLENLKIPDEAKQFIDNAAKEVNKKSLSHQEIINAAADVEILSKVMTRESTLKTEAALLKTRQHLAALAEQKEITPEFIDTIKTVSSYATNAGRELNALKIEANPILDSSKVKLTKKLLDMGIEGEKIIEASKNVDWQNSQQVTDFYRKLVKPTLTEIIDEYRFINLLSSPKTHIVNSFTNALQVAVVRPTTRIMSAGIDTIKSALTGKEKEYFLNQIPAYYKGAIGSIGDSFKKAINVVKGGTDIYRPDLSQIPTNIKWLKPFQGIPRVLEAADIFFGNIATQAEYAALLKRGVPEAQAIEKASKISRELIFRKSIDTTNKSGQGYLLSNIDKVTSAVYKLRDVPGVKWFVPFVQTPMNIAKQGIEYSPAGLLTLPGNANKVEQLGKTMVGSMVFGYGGWMAMDDKTTWSVPTNPSDRKAWDEAHMQPYSVKIGDNWVSYSKLGPIAFPLAMASAIKNYAKDNPKSVTDNALQKTGRVIAGMGKFFSDQSYLDGIGNLVNMADTKDIESLYRTGGSIASQMIPLAGLQRWVNGFIDDVYRKPSKDKPIESIIQTLESGIPGLYKNVPEKKGLTEEPLKKQYPIANAFSPMQITKENSEFKQFYEEKVKIGKERELLNKSKKENDKIIENGIKEYYKTQDMTILENLIQNQPDDEQSKVVKKVMIALRQEDIPSKYWYNTLKSLPPSIANTIFMERYNKATKEQKNIMLESSAKQGGIIKKVFKEEEKK